VLKFVFWILVGLNALVFAFGRGYLGNFKGEEHEPARLKNQVESGRLKLTAPGQAQPPAAAPAPAAPVPAASAPAAPVSAASAPSPAAPAASVAAPGNALACAEVGPLSASDERRFDTRLARLDLGTAPARSSVPVQEVTSRLVYVPSQGSKEAAERKAAELRALGLSNFFIISGDSPYKWGISLGLFKSEASAQAMLATLARQGVRSARIGPRGPVTNRTVYQFRGIDAATRAKIVEIAGRYDSAAVRACK
jgi:pyruvate/2-oxoglutarate dehydrogenase complex dihydrolipoamide acyltransferase (E2) component